MNLTTTLTENRNLWISFFATVLLTISFDLVRDVWGLTLLDAISDPAEARGILAAMSADQKSIHAWVTATLDVAYPFFYGAFFIGTAYKFFGKFGWLVAAPIFVLVATDLMEGVVQVAALRGITDWLEAKAFLTPFKFLLVMYGFAFTVVAWLIWMVGRFR